MHEAEWIYLNDHAWKTLQESSGKSLANHLDPKALIDSLGVKADAFSRSQTLRYTSEYLSLKEKYRRSLSSALSTTRSDVRSVMNYYFPAAYAYGIRSQGIMDSVSSITRNFTNEDKRFISVAVEEDLDYAVGFMKDLNGGYGKMPYHKRFQMYVEALDALYNAGAVAAMPKDVLIYWTGPFDNNKCASCSYLVQASPFIPETLPCQPKDGTTLCGSNCRDRLIVRPAQAHEVEVLRQSAPAILQQHNDALSNIRYNRKKKVFKIQKPQKQKPVTLKQSNPKKDFADKPSFYTQPKIKGRSVDISNLIQRYKTYQSDSVNTTPENVLTEGLFSGIKFISGSTKLLNTLKSLKQHLDIRTLYLAVSIHPFGSGGPVIKAGRLTEMIQWLNTAELVHKDTTKRNLYWTLLGITSFREDAEKRSNNLRTAYGKIVPSEPGDVWISNPRDRDGVFKDMYGHEIHTYRDVIIQKSKEAQKSDKAFQGLEQKHELLQYKNFFTNALRVLHIESHEYKRDSILKSVVTEVKRDPVIEAKPQPDFKTAAIVVAAVAGLRSYRILSGAVKMLSRTEFLTTYLILRIQPFGMGGPRYVAGDSTSVVEWVKKADTYHRMQYNKPLKWELHGVTTFRDFAESFGAWISDPNDDESILVDVIADYKRNPKSLNPNLQKLI